MVIEIKQAVYKTADGKLFLDRGDANFHEFRLELEALAEKESWGRGGHWDGNMFIDSLIENKHKIAEIFRPYLLPKATAPRDD